MRAMHATTGTTVIAMLSKLQLQSQLFQVVSRTALCACLVSPLMTKKADLRGRREASSQE